MGHDTLSGHIHTNYHLMVDANMSLDTINNMMPWERIVYVNLYVESLKKKKEEHEKQRAMARHG
tara:strand:+ start:275 stop:466 length:192 start_codon:yes stop_codon:yes gene_type:complete